MGLVRDVWPLCNLLLALVLLGVAWHGSTLSSNSANPRRRTGCTLLIAAFAAESMRAMLGIYVIQAARAGRVMSLPEWALDGYAMILPTVIRVCLILAVGILLANPRGRH